jgi:formylmethanofuran dehydrogenase subunit A
MYGCHLDKEPTRFQRLKNTHPKIYEYCMKSWNNGGLGLKDIMDYINENGNLRNKIKY